MKKYKNTVNTGTHITKSPTQLSKHPQFTKTHTYTHPHTTKEVRTTTIQDKHPLQ